MVKDDQCGNDKKGDEGEGEGQGRRNEGQVCRRSGVEEKGRTKAGNECNEAKELADQAAPDPDDDENQRYDDEQYIQSMHKGIAWRGSARYLFSRMPTTRWSSNINTFAPSAR